MGDTITITFTVRGAGFDDMTNPMPKLRYTGKQSWLPRVQNYVVYKEHVQNQLVKALKENYPHLYPEAQRRWDTGLKPLDTGKAEIKMHVHIHWRGFAHADPEGVFGSIADALLQNDKYLHGSFVYTHLPKSQQPYVIITLEIPSQI